MRSRCSTARSSSATATSRRPAVPSGELQSNLVRRPSGRRFACTRWSVLSAMPSAAGTVSTVHAPYAYVLFAYRRPRSFRRAFFARLTIRCGERRGRCGPPRRRWGLARGRWGLNAFRCANKSQNLPEKRRFGSFFFSLAATVACRFRTIPSSERCDVFCQGEQAPPGSENGSQSGKKRPETQNFWLKRPFFVQHVFLEARCPLRKPRIFCVRIPHIAAPLRPLLFHHPRPTPLPARSGFLGGAACGPSSRGSQQPFLASATRPSAPNQLYLS